MEAITTMTSGGGREVRVDVGPVHVAHSPFQPLRVAQSSTARCVPLRYHKPTTVNN